MRVSLTMNDLFIIFYKMHTKSRLKLQTMFILQKDHITLKKQKSLKNLKEDLSMTISYSAHSEENL